MVPPSFVENGPKLRVLIPLMWEWPEMEIFFGAGPNRKVLALGILVICPVDFLPKNDQIWPEIDIFIHIGPGLAGSFGALLSVVARGLYLARHLFTLFISYYEYFRSSRILFKNS